MARTTQGRSDATETQQVREKSGLLLETGLSLGQTPGADWEKSQSESDLCC